MDVLKDVKEVRRARIKEYVDAVPSAKYFEDGNVWEVPCDIAMPCATQNELDEESAKILVANGCKNVTEGANMPSTEGATDYFLEKGVRFLPGKAANAGGVAMSALEMSQNAVQLYRSFDDLDAQLNEIMKGIYKKISEAASDYDMAGNFVSGANIAGFRRVVKAMRDMGYV